MHYLAASYICEQLVFNNESNKKLTGNRKSEEHLNLLSRRTCLNFNKVMTNYCQNIRSFKHRICWILIFIRMSYSLNKYDNFFLVHQQLFIFNFGPIPNASSLLICYKHISNQFVCTPESKQLQDLWRVKHGAISPYVLFSHKHCHFNVQCF